MQKRIFFIIALLAIYSKSYATTPSEIKTDQYFSKIKSERSELISFLTKMPKGGDLHNHLGGASYAENMINYGLKDRLCLDKTTFTVSVNPDCTPENFLENAILDEETHHQIIDAWSMRHFDETNANQSGHDHFFAAFGKYSAISANHTGEMLAEVVNRAGLENEVYIELMVTPDNNASGMLGKEIGWDDDLYQLREKLLANGLEDIARDVTTQINKDESQLKKELFCDSIEKKPGCKVEVRYLYQILREQPKEQVFAQLLLGFEMAIRDSRFIGINMVQPEDGEISMRDYHLHMTMVNFLHELYPQVKISLHAGELAPGLVPDEGLKFHIDEALNIAHANRIGHGVDIAHETNVANILNTMEQNKNLVEINLTSNEKILNVEGMNHPILLYLEHNVPIALSTDDEGVDRSTSTMEYFKAVETFDFSYSTIKNFARNSISYSFLTGESLWMDDHYQEINPACKNDSPAVQKISKKCKAFLHQNDKANTQWTLEKRFNQFEENYN